MPLHAGEIAFGAKSSLICPESCEGLGTVSTQREAPGQQLDFAPPASLSAEGASVPPLPPRGEPHTAIFAAFKALGSIQMKGFM